MIFRISAYGFRFQRIGLGVQEAGGFGVSLGLIRFSVTAQVTEKIPYHPSETSHRLNS